MDTTFTVYVVWTMEDGDNVSIHLDKEAAEEEYALYEEFGCWEEKTFNIRSLIVISSTDYEISMTDPEDDNETS